MFWKKKEKHTETGRADTFDRARNAVLEKKKAVVQKEADEQAAIRATADPAKLQLGAFYAQVKDRYTELFDAYPYVWEQWQESKTLGDCRWQIGRAKGEKCFLYDGRFGCHDGYFELLFSLLDTPKKISLYINFYAVDFDDYAMSYLIEPDFKMMDGRFGKLYGHLEL